jgi:hypothetical protein
MRTIALVVLFISSLDLSGQSLDNWYAKSDSIFHSISDSTDIVVFNGIVNRRHDYFKKNFLDTTFNLIRVRELFDTKTNEFKVIFDYVDDGDKDYLFEQWTFLPVESIRPDNYQLGLGCLVRNRDKYKVNRWKRRIDRMEETKETYYIIDSLFDKFANTIKVSFQIPVTGKRSLSAWYGPFRRSRRPYLRTWE